MTKKILLNTIGMHCASCAMNIDGELEDTKGVKEANTNYAKQQTEVVYDEEQIDEGEIFKVVERVGYKANSH